MKKLFLILAAAFATMSADAQSPVPTSWDCTGAATPTGWTFVPTGGNGNTNYTGSSACDGASSLRLDAANEALVIFLGQQPGAVSYQIGGSTSGSPFEGTFVVQESVDGNTYTNMASYTDTDLSVNSCLSATVTPANPLSRYIRFFFQNKVSGSNVKLDEISIATPVISTASIDVKQGATTILNGGIADPFNGSTETFEVNNIGTTEDLVVTEVNFTGPNAGLYSVASPSLPFTVAAGESIDLVINFTPTASGTNVAGIELINNDLDDETFAFTLYGVNGEFASEPASGVTAIGNPVNKTFRTVISFDGNILNEDILGGYVVLRSEGASITTAPSDGSNYSRGQTIGNAKVIYAGRPEGASVSVNARYVLAGKTYYFAVFPYSGAGEFTNYINTISETSVTAPATMVSANEYTGISAANATLPTDLQAITEDHFSIFYSNYAPIVVNLFQARDTFATVGANTFTRVINCAYSGETKLFNDPFDWTGTGYSREHTFPHSWMPSFPADNPEKPEYNDYHNLFPTRQTNVNDVRCNFPLGEVVGTPTVEFLDGKLGLDANGKTVYEPRDQHKGRAARALMYMAVTYNSTANPFTFNNPIGQQCLSTQINYPQDQNLVKKWHFDYPPDAFDISRNDFLDSVQTNRNPFVDQPDLACYIDFSTVSHIANPPSPCWTLSANNVEDAVMNVNIFPNPSNASALLTFGMQQSIEYSLEVSDLSGRVVFRSSAQGQTGLNQVEIPTVDFSNGAYTVKIEAGNTMQVRKMMVAH
jgi:endonuclease I